MSAYENEITSICSAISSVCLVIAVLFIGVPKLLTMKEKKKTMDLKIKHLMNVIEMESRPNSVVQPPTHVVIDMKDLHSGKNRYSFVTAEPGSLSPSEVNPTAKTD